MPQQPSRHRKRQPRHRQLHPLHLHPHPQRPITLAISSAFETPAGALPPSIFIAAKSVALQDYLERIRARFPHLQYVDLVCGDVVKSAWVLPLAAQTAQAGTLAAFMSSLGLSVEEADLDAESDAESDVDSVRCDTEDDELPPGVYRDADGTVHDLDDGSYGTAMGWSRSDRMIAHRRVRTV